MKCIKHQNKYKKIYIMRTCNPWNAPGDSYKYTGNLSIDSKTDINFCTKTEAHVSELFSFFFSCLISKNKLVKTLVHVLIIYLP